MTLGFLLNGKVIDSVVNYTAFLIKLAFISKVEVFNLKVALKHCFLQPSPTKKKKDNVPSKDLLTVYNYSLFDCKCTFLK